MPHRDLVEIAFHLRREGEIENLRKMLDEQVVHGGADFGRHETPFLLRDVAPRLNRLHDRRVRRGPADAVLFKRLDQRSFGVSRRRFGKMLLGL